MCWPGVENDDRFIRRCRLSRSQRYAVIKALIEKGAVENVRRHRALETSWGAFQLTSPCNHHRGLLAFEHKNERAYADAMGCTWMTNIEARQAIPPAYTQHIGAELRALLLSKDMA